MPLSPAIEFLAAQKSESGHPLCQFGTSQVIVVFTPLRTISWTVVPPAPAFANYAFRVLLDESIPVGVFQISVRQSGAQPYAGIPYTSFLGRHIDYFIRVSNASPLVNLVTNLTNLNQRFISYDQSLVVRTQDAWDELERRLAEHFGGGVP